ncbi:MAG: hypothetical protein KIT14_21670 [bacterium]|nr:hypothetical protein [bacterium]
MIAHRHRERGACRLRGITAVAVLAVASLGHALPIELKDQNGTKYWVNTDVDPLEDLSNASGALTNATYVKPVTVTSYFVGFTPFFGFATVYTVQRQVDIPLTNAFAGFNGLAITSVGGTPLPAPRIYNPGEPLAAEECEQNGANRQLVFPTQTFTAPSLAVSRKVFVPSNGDFVRWMNVVTNTGAAPVEVGISLRGLLGSGSDTSIVATSTGGSSLGASVQWFTTAQMLPGNVQSDQPRLGFVVQGPGAVSPPTSVGINSAGQAAFTWTPTIAAGGTAIVMTFSTVQGSSKQAKNTVENLVDLDAKSINCLSEAELSQVVNFAPITPPQFKSATIELKFKKTGADTIQWKGKLTVAEGVSLAGLPVTVDVGGVQQAFVLDKQGKANDGNGNKFALNASLKNGVTKAGTYKFTFHLKGDFQTALADYGLVDASEKNVPVTLPVVFDAGPGAYATSQAFTYKATQGKSGTATGS